MSKYPKLQKMIVRNFRAIKESVEVDLDDIVILVGGNNSGKSTLLKAYEYAVNSEKLDLNDFPDCNVDKDNLPEVEIYTIVDKDTAPKIDIWCKSINESTFLVREKWTWNKLNEKPERVGFLIQDERWANKDDSPRMPWATDNVAFARRPKPHRVSTFDTPEIQSDAIKDIVNALLEAKIRAFKPQKQADDYPTLVSKFESLKQEFTEIGKEEVKEISKDITAIIKKIIPNHEFRFSIDDALKDDPFQIFNPNDIDIEFGEGQKLFPIINTGSGARRTILWAVLKKLAEMGYEAKKTTKGKKYEEIKTVESHLLLMDEPEISLHPSAIREASNVLYSLPDNDLWQVMVTTHSPNFIDLSRDHTTIVRVEKYDDSKIATTTLYRADKIEFTDDEKENLKLLNLVDPHVMEFFFGGRVVLVEGDTEFNAFNIIKEREARKENDEFQDVLIIRARGKVQISSLMKILNHFKKRYFVLHDTDTQKTTRKLTKNGEDGKKYFELIEITNPAWTNNEKILNNKSDYSSVYASLINFEVANFNENIISGKPSNVIDKLKVQDNYEKIKAILSGILNDNLVSDSVLKWNNMKELSDFVDSYQNINAKK